MNRSRTLTAVAIVVAALAGCSSSSSSSSSSGSSGADTAASQALVARTEAAGVPLLDQEAFETHIHTQLIVDVNGQAIEVPAGIGIDTDANRIAALHTHDATGLIHVESPEKHAKYTLGQFLTVWGMPADAAGQCVFFNAKPPCTVTVTSKDSGTVGLDVTLADQDELTLTVTST
jgi:hypothetical protein